MAAISAPSGPIIDPLDLDRYMGQDPDQSPEVMLIRSKVQVLPMLNPNPANQVAPSKVFQPYTKRKAASKCSGCGGAHTIRQCGKPPNQKKQKNG
jgi:hypothetical protein